MFDCNKRKLNRIYHKSLDAIQVQELQRKIGAGYLAERG
jgi:hypothetical protein